MKSTTFASETAILIKLPYDEIHFFDDVTKVVAKGSTLYVHRNKSGYDDVVKLENVIGYEQHRK